MAWMGSEILKPLLHIISASLTLVFAVLDKSCVIFSYNLINVLFKCGLNSHVVESIVRKRKSSVIVRFFIVQWEQKWVIWDVAAWAWTGGKAWKFGISAGLGRSTVKKGEEQMKSGVEGTGSWNYITGKFPPSLSPKILWNPGVSRILSVLLVHAEGNQSWLWYFGELQVAEPLVGCECPTSESVHLSRGAVPASLCSTHSDRWRKNRI